jgi:hypothetical protein
MQESEWLGDSRLDTIHEPETELRANSRLGRPYRAFVFLGD